MPPSSATIRRSSGRWQLGQTTTRHAVLPGVTDKPPGRVEVGELDPGLAPLALDLFALHRSELPLELDLEVLGPLVAGLISQLHGQLRLRLLALLQGLGDLLRVLGLLRLQLQVLRGSLSRRSLSACLSL